MRANRIVCLCASVFYLAFITSTAYAVASKLTINNTAGKKLKIQANTISGPVPIEAEQDDTNKRVAGFIPDNASSVTITDEATGNSAVLDGPFTSDRTVEFSSLVFLGGGAAAAPSAVTGWGSSATQDRTGWRIDGIVAIGGTTSLESTNATSTGTGFGTGSSSMGSLSGPTGSLMLRLHLPANVTGPLGDVWMFARWNEQFNRNGTGGNADVHAPVPGNDTSTNLTRERDLEVGLGKSIETYKQQYLGVYVGASFQQNKITTTSNEAGPVRVFENQTWMTSIVTGAWYQVPLSGLGQGWDRLSGVLGVDFRRIPSMGVNGQSPITTYRGTTDSFWEVTTWAGLGLSL